MKKETPAGGKKMTTVVGKEPETVSWLGGRGRIELKSLA